MKVEDFSRDAWLALISLMSHLDVALGFGVGFMGLGA